MFFTSALQQQQEETSDLSWWRLVGGVGASQAAEACGSYSMGP